MTSRPALVAFDVIGTVFSLEKLRDRIKSVGLPGTSLETWFAQTLRDAFALEVTEIYQPFRDIASATLAGLFSEHNLPQDSSRIETVLDGFAELSPYADARTAFTRLHDAGIRVIALTNGSANVTKSLLQRADFDGLVERIISIEEVRHWKPRQDVYLYAAKCAGVEPTTVALVSAHPWDIHGAGRAGLITAYVARGKPFSTTMMPPRFTAPGLAEIADAVLAPA